MSVCLWSFVFNQFCWVTTNFSIQLIPNLAERSGAQTAVERLGEVMDARVVTLCIMAKSHVFSFMCSKTREGDGSLEGRKALKTS